MSRDKSKKGRSEDLPKFYSTKRLDFTSSS